MAGVCRGTLSEGIDFTDEAARCVIMIGVPYPKLSAPRIFLKRHFLDN